MAEIRKPSRKRATLKLDITIEFDDDGWRNMSDQATEAALFELGIQLGKTGDAIINSGKVVGKVTTI